MTRYVEIEDLKEITLANHLLARNMKRSLPHREQRTVGFPSSYFVDEVRFASGSVPSLWWNGGVSVDKPMYLHLFGRGSPRVNETLLIDLQFNFPTESFNRRMGGVFLRDNETNEVLLGHRGIVTRGKSRMPKDRIFLEAGLPILRASTSDGGSIEVLVVCPVDHPNLLRMIDEFCLEMRRAATAVAEAIEEPKLIGCPAQSVASTLKAYFEEFSGQSESARGTPVLADWEHGRIVAALRNSFSADLPIYKNSLCDLIVVYPGRVRLYEVKTRADRQSLYGGVGQLLVNAAGLKDEFPGATIEKVLVAPFAHTFQISKKIFLDLGISIVSVVESGGVYGFEALSN